MRILIADDHMLIRQALSAILESLYNDADIREADGFDGTFEHVESDTPLDLALLDLQMPGPPWRESIARIRATRPDLPIVILSGSEARDDIVEALRLGARGYIPKSLNVSVMRAALELILSGGVYLPPNLLGVVEEGGATEPDIPVPRITPRQRQILGELRKGLSNKEIARNLDLSEGTVKLHVTALLKSLNVANRTQAVLAADRLGLVSKGE